MFRGGRVDSRGTGITANLGYNNGGRVGFQNGGKSGLDFLKQAFLGPRFTDPNFQPPKLFPKNVSMNFGQSPRDFAGALTEGSAYREYLTPKKEEFETEVTESGDVKFKLDKDGNRIPIDTTDLSLKETIEKKRIEDVTSKDPQGSLEEMGVTVKKDGTTEFTGDPRFNDQKIKGKKIEIEEFKNGDGKNEDTSELTVEDYVKMLGGDKARRRDVSDLLAQASASFLGTGGVREGLSEFMQKVAASGPGRLEKIEQAAATLDIKDKIASKRAEEQLKMLLGKADYEAMLKLRMSDPGLQSFETNLEDSAKALGKSYKNIGVIGNAINKKYGSGSFGGEVAEDKNYIEGKFYIQDTGTGEKIVFKIIDSQPVEVHRIR
tara:strand:- start:3300 stop:4430 length:1131 start_codon:yes stop_codon:yes gene_type:complete